MKVVSVRIQPISDLLQVDADPSESLGHVGVVSCGHHPEVVVHVDPDQQAAVFTQPAPNMRHDEEESEPL